MDFSGAPPILHFLCLLTRVNAMQGKRLSFCANFAEAILQTAVSLHMTSANPTPHNSNVKKATNAFMAL